MAKASPSYRREGQVSSVEFETQFSLLICLRALLNSLWRIRSPHLILNCGQYIHVMESVTNPLRASVSYCWVRKILITGLLSVIADNIFNLKLGSHLVISTAGAEHAIVLEPMEFKFSFSQTGT